MKKLKIFFLITDIGFILYWLITLFHAIPEQYLYKDYSNSLLVSWNWSFFPLDMFISFTGLMSLYIWKKGSDKWALLALCSLVLTFCSGLQAISFWTLRNDYDVTWWVFNGYLMIYPIPFIYKIINKSIMK